MSIEDFRQSLLGLLSLSFMFLIGTLIYVFKSFRADFQEFRIQTNEALFKLDHSIGKLNVKVSEVIIQANTHKDEIAILREKTDELALEQARMGKAQ